MPPAAPAKPLTASPATTTQTVLDGIPVGFTPDGYPYRGATDAPVTLVEYSDYLCPFCARHTTQTVPSLMDQYIRTGKVQWVFRDDPIASLHPTSAQGHRAALCVAEQGAALFWKMHDQLFATQSQWNQLPDPGAYLTQVAQTIGAGKALRFQARDNSMQQLLRDGDLLLVQPVDATSIWIGDVVLCHSQPGRVVVHRVLRRQAGLAGDSFIVQGARWRSPMERLQGHRSMAGLRRSSGVTHSST